MVEQHIQGEASGTWEDNSAIEQHTQTDWCNDWDQHLSKQKAVVQNAQKAKSKVSILARLVNHTASLKGRLDGKAFSSRRQHLSGTTLVSLDHDEEYEDGEEYEDSDWAEVKPTVRFRVSKLTAKWRDAVKQKLDQVRGHKGEDEENEGFNDPWLSDDSEKQVGASDGPNEGSTLGIDEEPIFPKFTTPLPGALKTEDFLTRFLVERRQVNIYPERKHNLALSLFRICQEAAFDHVKLHAPRRLVLRGVDTADQLEFEYWIRLMDRLRDAKEIPHDGKDWYYSEIWFESYVQERDNILRLRQVDVHHWDYDSNMIGHVVEFLARLDDHPGRRMVENALAELYEYECVVAAKAEALAISDACSWNQVGVPTGSTNSISHASSLTLVGEGSSQDARASDCDSRYLDCSAVDVSNTDNEGDVTMTSTMAATDKKTAIKSSASFDPMAGIFVGDVFSPQLIDKSLLVTTHHQLLKSYQTILERSIYDALWRGEDSISKSRTAPHEMRQRDCWALISKSCDPSTLPVSNETSEYIVNLLHRCQAIRNMAAHHHPLLSTKDLLECYQDALTLTYLLNDEDATRKIELTTWAAHLNLSARAAKKEEMAMEKSVLDWEKLDCEANSYWNDFRARAVEAGKRLWGIEGEKYIRRWEEHELMIPTNPREQTFANDSERWPKVDAQVEEWGKTEH